MATDNSCHIPHTAVAYFDVISIEQFMVAVVWWEMFIHKHKKLTGNISCNVLIIWRVKPYYIAFSLRFFVSRVLIVSDVSRVATVF